jgi:FlaA1/EpsC-like NDP-sugar epimerase
VLISTDKAANPTSVLGATKRLAELVLDSQQPASTVLTAVRFGNVLGSRGSLLHVLHEQLVGGHDITVTHPEVTRFFMTIEEAVGLVLEAARMANGHSTYVLDMGEPVRILDVVQNFSTMLNLPAVNIRFTGLRPGEKLHEELFGDGEKRHATDHGRIWSAELGGPAPRFRAELYELYEAAAHNRPDEVLEQLTHLVPQYTPPAPVAPSPAAALAPYPDDY